MTPAARHRVDAGGGHGDQRRCAAVDRKDGRADLHALGLGGEEPHEARRVEAVGLGHPDDIEPDLLQRDGLAGRFLEPTGVVQRHGQLHAVPPSLGPAADKRVYSTPGRSGSSIAGVTGGPIDLVLFDLGGVLIQPGGVGPMRDLSGIESDEALWARWLSCPWVRRFEAGRCTPEAFAAGVVADWELELDPDAFLQEFGRWPEPPFPDALDLVSAVQQSVPAGFLSNMNAFQWAANYEAIPLTDAFAFRFLSFELGLVKPDAAIFDAVAEQAPGPPPAGPLPRRQRHERGGRCAGGVRVPPCSWGRGGPRCAGGGRRARKPDGPAPRRAGAGWGPPPRLCQHAAMVANGPMLRLLPRLDDDVTFFWTSGEDGVLRFLRCNACGFYIHPARPGLSALPLA